MSFHVVAPPAEINHLMNQGENIADAVDKTGVKLAEIAKPLWSAAERLGITLDVPGFLYAWLAGTRVLVEKDAKGEIVTMAFMAVGKKWTTNDDSATVLELRGAHLGAMLDFAKAIAAGVGARVLYHEANVTIRPDGIVEHTVLAYPTG